MSGSPPYPPSPRARLNEERERIETIFAIATTNNGLSAAGVDAAIAAIRDGTAPEAVLPSLLAATAYPRPMTVRARQLGLIDRELEEELLEGHQRRSLDEASRARTHSGGGDLIDRVADALLGPEGAPRPSPPPPVPTTDDRDLVDRAADAFLGSQR